MNKNFKEKDILGKRDLPNCQCENSKGRMAERRKLKRAQLSGNAENRNHTESVVRKPIYVYHNCRDTPVSRLGRLQMDVNGRRSDRPCDDTINSPLHGALVRFSPTIQPYSCIICIRVHVYYTSKYMYDVVH